MVYKTNERVFIVNIYLKTKSHKAVGEEFLEQFKREDPSDKYRKTSINSRGELIFRSSFKPGN